MARQVIWFCILKAGEITGVVASYLLLVFMSTPIHAYFSSYDQEYTGPIGKWVLSPLLLATAILFVWFVVVVIMPDWIRANWRKAGELASTKKEAEEV